MSCMLHILTLALIRYNRRCIDILPNMSSRRTLGTYPRLVLCRVRRRRWCVETVLSSCGVLVSLCRALISSSIWTARIGCTVQKPKFFADLLHLKAQHTWNALLTISAVQREFVRHDWEGMQLERLTSQSRPKKCTRRSDGTASKKLSLVRRVPELLALSPKSNGVPITKAASGGRCSAKLGVTTRQVSLKARLRTLWYLPALDCSTASLPTDPIGTVIP